jgi:sugar phosphate isomerase/epimerase
VTGRFAVCEIALRQGSFAADVELVRAAGIAAIGVAADAVDAVGVDEARRILDGEGVRVSSYMGAGIILENDGTMQSLDETARRIDVAAALGAAGALVLTGPLGALDPSDADSVCREWLARVAPVAIERGMRIMLEPVHPLMRHLSYVHTVEHGIAVVDGIEGAGIVLDVGHVWWERDVDALIRDNVADIVSVQLTNVDAAALGEFRYQRAPLYAGDVPVGSLVQALESSGYRGWYEYEVLVRTPRDKRLEVLRAAREWFEDLTLR